MADDPTIENQDAPKSAADLRIEELYKRLDAMETSYRQQIAELTEANKGLWMELHKVPADIPTATASDTPQGPDPAEKALYEALGLQTER